MSSKRIENSKRWKNLVERYRASGHSQKKFAQDSSVSLASLCYWLKKDPLVPTSSAGFVAVKVSDRPRTEVKIALQAGPVLTVPSGTDPSWVGRLVSSLSICTVPRET